jgi:hypothetical protein
MRVGSFGFDGDLHPSGKRACRSGHAGLTKRVDFVASALYDWGATDPGQDQINNKMEEG